jgi:hypothetical protein
MKLLPGISIRLGREEEEGKQRAISGSLILLASDLGALPQCGHNPRQRACMLHTIVM